MDFADLEKVLKAYDGTTFVVSKSQKKILKAFADGKLLIQNYSYENFVELVFKREGLILEKSPIEYANLYNSFKETETAILVPLNMIDGTKTNISIKKIFLDDDIAVCFFEDISKTRNMVGLMDALTGAYNKNYVPDLIKKELSLVNPRPFYMFILDVDNFKNVNDSLGHMYGDKVLILVTDLLKKHFKDGIISRIGGDEFMVLCYGLQDYDSVWKQMHELYVSIEKIRRSNPKFSNIGFTCGLSRSIIDGNDYDTLFIKADKALYRGKRKGKSCFIIYNDEKHRNINLDLIKKEDSLDLRRGDSSVNKAINTIFSLLNSEAGIDANIKNVFKYLSNYFTLDRVLFYESNMSGTQSHLKYSYAVDTIENASLKYVKLVDTNKNAWDEFKSFDGTVIMKRVHNLIDSSKVLYDYLVEEHCNASVRFTLSFNNIILGYLRVDDCHSENRMWQLENIELMKTIIHLLEMYLYKSNENKMIQNKIQNDSLTGLLNYHYFVLKGDTLLTQKTMHMVVYYLNFRHFKFVNDNYGFKIGDLLLKNMADILTNVFNGPDTLIARSTDDRFMVLCPYISNKMIEDQFNEIVSNFAKFEYDHNSYFSITIDCGVYITDGAENNMSLAIDKANLARRYAKDNAKGNYVLYSQTISDKYRTDRELESHFNEALLTNEIEIFLQPKIDIKTGVLVGAEALSRWKYNGSYLMPNRFIPILEHSGAITDLDFYVFENVCKIQKRFLDTNTPAFPISVNLSKYQSRLEEYVTKIESVRSRYQIPPHLIEIEIVESMILKNASLALKIVNQLHQYGYKVSMDDFGSGYSNLSFLANIPVDTLKLDKSLCENAGSDRNDKILASMISLAKQLNIDVICEGVETKKQANSLLEIGCEKAQGYLYDKPITIDEFINKYLKY